MACRLGARDAGKEDAVMKDNKNPPAFPCPVRHIDCNHPIGMTLRDYFAAAALTGMLSTGKAPKAREKEDEGKCQGEIIANLAYFIADFMLIERENTNE